MKRLIIISIIALYTSAAFAQVDNNTSNNLNTENNEQRIPAHDPEIVFDGESPFNNIYIPAPQVRSLDNILWKKTVWRMIDMREQVNYPLYYPIKASNGRKNLFMTIFNLVMDGKVTPYEYFEDKEEFTEDTRLSIKKVLENAKIDIYEPVISDEGDTTYKVEDIDVPSADVLKFFIKEVWYFDAMESAMKFKIECIAPRLYYENENGETIPTNIFWVKFDDLRPWLAKQSVVINNKNSTAYISYDDLFQKRRFVGHIYKEDNIQNRTLLQYCKNHEEVRSEQIRIENEIRNFEEDLWEY